MSNFFVFFNFGVAFLVSCTGGPKMGEKITVSPEMFALKSSVNELVSGGADSHDEIAIELDFLDSLSLEFPKKDRGRFVPFQESKIGQVDSFHVIRKKLGEQDFEVQIRFVSSFASFSEKTYFFKKVDDSWFFKYVLNGSSGLFHMPPQQ